jgi:hypothetical protein
LKLAIFVKALKTVVAVNVKLLANLLVKQAAVSQTNSARTPKRASN